jgi:predicted transcriptional regulator
MNDITKLEWNVLDSLSDHEETIGVIMSSIKEDFPDISTREVTKSVYRLWQQGLIFEDNHQNIDYQTPIDESADYLQNVYCFARLAKYLVSPARTSGTFGHFSKGRGSRKTLVL